MFIGGAEVAAAVSVPSPLSVPTAIVGAGNVLYGFSDVFEGISVLTGNGSINFGRDLLFDGDQKKWDAAGAVLDISGFALTGASTGWGKAAKAGMTSAPEVLRSIATQLGKMYLSASVASTAGSYVEGAVTDVEMCIRDRSTRGTRTATWWARKRTRAHSNTCTTPRAVCLRCARAAAC